MDILTTFTQSIQSKPVTICAGEEGQELTVHEAFLLNSDSPSLKKLLEPSWLENSEGRIDWKHTNVATVLRVLTFLYYQDYHSPNPRLRESHDERKDEDGKGSEVNTTNEEVVTDPEGMAGGTWDAGLLNGNEDIAPAVEPEALLEGGAPEYSTGERQSVEDEDHNLQDAILKSCNTRPLTPLGICAGVSPITTVRKTAGGYFADQEFPSQKYSYQEPLLAHAEVYSFAKYHLLSTLQDLALQRMTQTLRYIDCSVESVQEELSVVIAFVYDNVTSDNDAEEPMQKILSQFAAIHYTSLLHGKFEELFCRGGDFTRDVARKLSRRLSAHGVAVEIENDEVDSRIDNLETQIQQRDVRIKSLTASLSDALEYGRGLGRKYGKRR